MKACFINLPLVTKETLTNNEINFYAAYWHRMDRILGKSITSYRFAQKDNNMQNSQPAYDIQELPIWVAALSPLIRDTTEILFLDLFEYTSSNIDIHEIKNRIQTNKADLYLMSPLLLNQDIAKIIAQIIKELHGNRSKIVIGGPFATYESKTFIESRHINAVYRGRVLPDFTDFLEKLSNGSDLYEFNNVSWKKNDKIINNPLSNVKTEFVNYDYSIIPESYKDIIPWARLYCSEGCPWACAYCADVIWNRTKPRYKDVHSVLDIADRISKRFDVDTFYVGDETFTYDPSFVKEFSKGMRALGLQWFCQTRIDQVDEKLLQEMKNGNCRMVKFGAESASQPILNKINKGIRVADVASACEMVKQTGMSVFTYWLVGLPLETEVTALNTIDQIEMMLRSGICDLIEWFICVPYPGTDLYRNPDKYDIRIDKKPWKQWREDSPSVLNTAELSSENIYKIWDEGLGRFASALCTNEMENMNGTETGTIDHHDVAYCSTKVAKEGAPV